MKQSRKWFIVGIIAFLLLAGTTAGSQVGVAAPAAEFNLAPTDDAYVRLTSKDSSYNTTNLTVVADAPPDGPQCTPNRIAYLMFDLSAIPAGDNVDTAVLTMAVSGSAGSLTMAVKGSTDNTWSEDGVGQPALTWNSQPILGAPLAKAPSAASGTVSFSGADLTQFLGANKGQLVTLAITSVGNDDVNYPCGGDPQPYQYFSSKEGAVAPKLTINSSPLALSLSTFRSADPAVNWPLIVGLGALAAVVVGGLAVSRKRAARG